jgi:uncharacterized protein involved in type VI secretion and phage assembly
MSGQKDNGVVVGLVTSLDDPERIGRVRVKFPHLEDQQSDWARLVSGMAGPDRGLFLRPEVGDEVLVAFEQGDPRRPYILGSLWSKPDKPPADDGNATQNNWRFLKSRSGHIVKLDDTPNKERIEILDKDGARHVIVDSAAQKIQIVCDTGDVEVSAPTGTVKISAMTVDVEAQGSMTLQAAGTMTIKGSIVNIN